MANGRALIHGLFWSEDGHLLATVTQQALFRGKL